METRDVLFALLLAAYRLEREAHITDRSTRSRADRAELEREVADWRRRWDEAAPDPPARNPILEQYIRDHD